ncbi:MAG: class I SAM-dependent methyltransferase [Patescibacteria group bacterium]
MKAKTKVRNCPLCNSHKKEILYTQIFSGHFSHKIVCCKNCGFIYVANTPSQEYYSKYYKEESKYEGIREHEAHEVATKNELNKFINKNVKENARILDVGCSTGFLLSYIKNKGYKNVYGIDPAPKCRLMAKEKYGVDVGVYDLNSFHPKKKYDLIIISQVLEHLTDIKDSMEKVHSWLNNGGYLFIGVPDAEKFHLNFDEPFGEFSTEHINFFTESSFYYLMNNFKNVMMKSDGDVLFSVWQKLNQGKRGFLKYIELSEKKLKKVKKVINKLPEKTIVWGVGALTRRLLSTTKLRNKILFFVDSSPNLIGKSINGLSIYSPDVLKEYNNPVFISSFKFRDEIIKSMKNKKLDNKIFTI